MTEKDIALDMVRNTLNSIHQVLQDVHLRNAFELLHISYEADTLISRVENLHFVAQVNASKDARVH